MNTAKASCLRGASAETVRNGTRKVATYVSGSTSLRLADFTLIIVRLISDFARRTSRRKNGETRAKTRQTRLGHPRPQESKRAKTISSGENDDKNMNVLAGIRVILS